MTKEKQMNQDHVDRWLREMAESDVRLDIRLTNDFAFKKTFHNVKALKGLLSALLEIPPEEIQKIEFMDTFLRGDYPDEKEGILDIRVHLNGNRKLNIELQVNFFPYWKERSLFVTVQTSLNCYASSPLEFAFGEGLDACNHCVFVRSAQ